MPDIALKNTRLHYQDFGTGDPLLLVQGFFADRQAWADIVPAFTDRYRVIAPDLRGHESTRVGVGADGAEDAGAGGAGELEGDLADAEVNKGFRT